VKQNTHPRSLGLRRSCSAVLQHKPLSTKCILAQLLLLELRPTVPAPNPAPDPNLKPNAMITVQVSTHGQSVPDPSKPRSPSWSECNFELADYDPSLPLHLFITVKLHDRDGMVVKPWQGEHLTRNFAFGPAVHDSRREWDCHSRV
jgi:hypothetical protein